MIANKEFNILKIKDGEPLPSGVLKDLLNGKITGVLFQNFMSSAEISLMKDKVKNIDKSKKTIINNGFTSYPISFAQFTQMKSAHKMTIEEYVEIAADALENQEENFGLNFTKRLFDFLSLQEEFKNIGPIVNKEYNKPLVPFNLRELSAGEGELIIHCENLFFDEFPNFFNWLKLMDIKENKLSYFLTIQEAEKGGELACYDMFWEEVKVRKSPEVLLDVNEIEININDVKKNYIKPKEGDLLLFAGGDIWHRVEKIEGSKSRITIGGFIAESLNSSEYYVWA